MAYTLAEHMDHLMSTAELVLNGVTTEMRSRHVADAASFAALMASKEVHDILAEKSEGLRGIDGVTLVADNGDAYCFNRYHPISGINLSDRDFFQAHAADPGLGLFISRPVRDRADGRWTIYLSRRLDDVQGRFMGLVLVGLSGEYLEAFFQDLALLLGEGLSISLYRKDRMLMARYPQNDQGIGSINEQGGTSVVLRDLNAGGGVVSVYSPFLGQTESVRRVVAVEQLQRYPLAVTVAATEKLYLSGWRPVFYFVLAAGGSSLAAVMLPLGLLLRAVRQREADLAELERLNNDIMERQAVQDRLTHDATHDELTGLPRMSLFLDRMEQALLKAGRNRMLVGVIFLDIDHFKEVNDTLGHQAGDELLREVAARLKARLRQIDTVARYGGDEFVVLLSEASDQRKLYVVAEKLRTSLAEPFTLAGREHRLSASLGLAVYPADGTEAGDLLKCADQRMYLAKSRGRNQVRTTDAA